MKGPERVETARVILRKPCAAGAEIVFLRYPEATRLVGWPTRRSVEYARFFVTFSDSEWERWPESTELATGPGCLGLGFWRSVDSHVRGS